MTLVCMFRARMSHHPFNVTGAALKELLSIRVCMSEYFIWSCPAPSALYLRVIIAHMTAGSGGQSLTMKCPLLGNTCPP